MSEILDIFDAKFNKIGVEDRDIVHEKGLWHQTFHCWIIAKRGDKTYLLVQKRSAKKKQAPNQVDITAAGHLATGETKEDGIREISEELGLQVNPATLRYLGIRISASDKNKEFAHVYLLQCDQPLEDYTLQEEEVSGLIEIEIKDGLRLFSNEVEVVDCKSVFVENGKKTTQTYHLHVSDFIERIDPYYYKIFIMAERYFEGKKYLSI